MSIRDESQLPSEDEKWLVPLNAEQRIVSYLYPVPDFTTARLLPVPRSSVIRPNEPAKRRARRESLPGTFTAAEKCNLLRTLRRNGGTSYMKVSLTR